MQRDRVLELFKNCDFSSYVTNDNFEENILAYLPDDFSYKYFYGVSKLCIIPEGADYVIKIPFNAKWYEVYEEYDWFYEANYFDRERGWDYCLTELLYYKEAQQRKVHRMFCKARLLGYVNNYPIYIQERAVTYCDLNRDDDREDARTPSTRDYCRKNGFLCFNPIWIADALDYYGQKMFNKMMSFIKSYHIGDLHDENIGYIGQRPVLIDYSDFLD